MRGGKQSKMVFFTRFIQEDLIDLLWQPDERELSTVVKSRNKECMAQFLCIRTYFQTYLFFRLPQKKGFTLFFVVTAANQSVLYRRAKAGSQLHNPKL